MEHGSGPKNRLAVGLAGDLASGRVGGGIFIGRRRAVLLCLEAIERHNKRLKQSASAGQHRAPELTETRPPLLRHSVSCDTKSRK